MKSGPRQGLRNLIEFEKPANALIASLNDAQLKEAVVSTDVPDVTTTPNSARPEPTAAEGISSDKLNPAQRELLSKFVASYHANFPRGVARI